MCDVCLMQRRGAASFSAHWWCTRARAHACPAQPLGNQTWPIFHYKCVHVFMALMMSDGWHWKLMYTLLSIKNKNKDHTHSTCGNPWKLNQPKQDGAMRWKGLKNVRDMLYFHAYVRGSTAAQLSLPTRFDVNTFKTHLTRLASITTAAQTINPTKAYLRIAPDPTLPAGPWPL